MGMSSCLYNWKRFWCPREGSFSLGDSGYLTDPESKWGRDLQPQVVAFDKIQTIPCLLLLGEPGIGKSCAIASEQDSIVSHAATEQAQFLWFDLRSYGSEIRLCQGLFEDPKFLDWKHGDHHLHLFLDSLDECLLQIDTLSALLIEEFRKHPVDRLSLRIACRTADLPLSLEKGLAELWPTSLSVYELTPLRKRDVREAAGTEGVEVDSFLEEVDRRNAVPLAIKPVTLNFLLKKYRKDGELPARQVDLYMDGCRLLCEELKSDLRESSQSGNHSAIQRLAGATRLAAITIFGNKYAAWAGLEQGDVPDEDVTVRQALGGQESLKGETLQVDHLAIREVLSTGLFTSRGLKRFGWSHQTYAEFLAAVYLDKQSVSLERIMDLLSHPDDPESKIVPQLHESAAWAASLRPELFRHIVKTEPEILLRSDVATADQADRFALVDALLERFDQGLSWDEHDLRGHYRKLRHPSLSAQLQPYIVDKSKGAIARRFAIDVAEACEIKTLLNDLADVSLDTTDEYQLRVQALCAISRIGDVPTKNRLIPLIKIKPKDDPDDELKGYALESLWPDLIEAKDLFRWLNKPQQSSFFGGYAVFLRKLAKSLLPQHMIHALRFVGKHRSGSFDAFSRLQDEIILRAWHFVGDPKILRQLAKTLIERLETGFPEHSFESDLRSFLKIHDEERRMVVEEIVRTLPQSALDLTRFAFMDLPIVTSADTLWLLKKCAAARSPQKKSAIAQLIFRIWDPQEPAQTDAIIIASERNAVLRDKFKKFLTPVVLGSPQAIRLRQEHLELQRPQPNQKALVPSPADRIETLLCKFESGDTAVFWQLNREMTLEEHSTHYGSDFVSDLKSLPGWTNNDQRTRSRVVECAQRYLLRHDPEASTWLAGHKVPRPALAAYRAFRLLLDEDPTFVDELSRSIWEKWAPSILGFPHSDSEEQQAHNVLVARAYAQAPNQLLGALRIIIKRENDKHEHIFITDSLTNCLDEHLCEGILEEIRSGELKPAASGELLKLLIKHGDSSSESYAKLLVGRHPYANAQSRSLAVAAAKALLEHSRDAGWTTVWPAVQADTDFGRKTFEEVAHFGSSDSSVASRLNEDQIADLYLWLCREYPPSEDPHFEEAHAVGPRESVGTWRSSLLGHLRDRGTFEACVAIERIASEQPGNEWLKWMLFQARVAARRQTWSPPSPSDILKFLENTNNRLVRNGDELLKVVVESLDRLQVRLQGETPAAIDLWNKLPSGQYRPKDEPALADYIKRHLKDDLATKGVVVGREVEIRRGEGSRPGERTDIYVSASTSVPDEESAETIIEVKGCWNVGLNTAMKSQLVNRYLKDNQCHHGLYLVGWFQCSEWDQSDWRYNRCSSGIIGTKDTLEAKAAGLSTGGIKVKAMVLDLALC